MPSIISTELVGSAVEVTFTKISQQPKIQGILQYIFQDQVAVKESTASGSGGLSLSPLLSLFVYAIESLIIISKDSIQSITLIITAKDSIQQQESALRQKQTLKSTPLPTLNDVQITSSKSLHLV